MAGDLGLATVQYYWGSPLAMPQCVAYYVLGVFMPAVSYHSEVALRLVFCETKVQMNPNKPCPYKPRLQE